MQPQLQGIYCLFTTWFFLQWRCKEGGGAHSGVQALGVHQHTFCSHWSSLRYFFFVWADLCHQLRYTHLLFVKVQETAKGTFRSSSQAATCYYQSNHSKVQAIPLSTLPKGTTIKRTSRPIFTLSIFYAERQAEKLWKPTLKVFWSNLARESNPGNRVFI